MAARLEELSGLGCWEWQIASFGGETLTLAGGQDMTYGHFAEADFHGVTYICCPTRMMHPRFRLAVLHEEARAGLHAEVEPGSFVIAIDSGTTASLDEVSLIAAREVEVRRDVR